MVPSSPHLGKAEYLLLQLNSEKPASSPGLTLLHTWPKKFKMARTTLLHA
jgi:hypothetical protein